MSGHKHNASTEGDVINAPGGQVQGESHVLILLDHKWKHFLFLRGKIEVFQFSLSLCI